MTWISPTLEICGWYVGIENSHSMALNSNSFLGTWLVMYIMINLVPRVFPWWVVYEVVLWLRSYFRNIRCNKTSKNNVFVLDSHKLCFFAQARRVRSQDGGGGVEFNWKGTCHGFCKMWNMPTALVIAIFEALNHLKVAPKIQLIWINHTITWAYMIHQWKLTECMHFTTSMQPNAIGKQFSN